ncbi:MAG: HAMP domain-containing protein [Chloroflexi bacterium]|nr:HAMP domain-containing protein [Chloroflexota bacterium]
MLNRLTIRQRILVIFIGIAFVGGTVQFLIAGRQLEAATLEFYQHHLETDALLVAATFAEPLGHYLEGEDEGGIGRMLAALQQEVGHDYLILDRNYRVVGYTANTGYEQVDRVPVSPELVEADSVQIGSDIRPNHVGEAALYLAVSVRYEGEALGYLVLSEPMAPAYAEVNRRYMELAIATLPVLVLVVAASMWVSSTISRPVQHLRNSALNMAQGALDTRIQVTTQDEIGQLGKTLNFMAGQLETLMKTQRNFVSNAAHELRTPLMTLKLRAEALSDETLPKAERETYLTEIQQEIDHMAELVSSLLLLARIDEGRHTQNGVVTDTASILHDLIRHWRIEAEAKQLEFATQIDPDLPELPMSSNDLRVIVDNLLSNAVKYTEQGRIQMTVASTPQMVTIQVSDTGIGFSEEQQRHLFERFYRSDTVRGRYNGNGLGLSIIEAILEHYGGQITTVSRGPGQGAIFTATVPLVKPLTARRSHLPHRQAVPDGSSH